MSRIIILTSWGLVATGLVSAQLLSQINRRRFASLQELIGLLTTRTWGFVLLFFAWGWLGWHLFAR